ncbi:MAG: PstS family phosphate ABC transporter substrate-binding protein [Cyanophyceae cyanobacterium]
MLSSKDSTPCPRCGYTMNSDAANQCRACGHTLHSRTKTNVFKFPPTPDLAPAAPSPGETRPKPVRPGAMVIGAVIGALVAGLAIVAVSVILRQPFRLLEPSTTRYRTIAEVPTPDMRLTFSGDAFFAALNRKGLSQIIADAHPEFELIYLEPGDRNASSSDGIEGVIKGTLSLATTSRPLTDTESQAAITQQTLRDFTLAQEAIGIGGTVFYTNREVELAGLTIDQLRGIFTGTVTNWKQVGGPDLPIHPVGIEIETLEEIGLGEGTLGNNVEIVRSPTLAFREVIGTPGAIGFVSAALASQQGLLNVLNVENPITRDFVSPLTEEGMVNLDSFQTGDYPLTNKLFILYREDGTLDEEAGRAYTQMLLSKEGQEIVQNAGFVPLVPSDE